MNEGNLIIQSVKRGSTGEQQCIIPQIKNARQKGKTQKIQTNSNNSRWKLLKQKLYNVPKKGLKGQNQVIKCFNM